MENRLIDSLRRADRFWLLDGAMGTQLQKKLVAAGRSILGLIPELCCITEPELVTQVHREYLEAGADILYTNTFGANRKKLTGSGYTPQQIIPAAVGCAKQAATGKDTLVALDIGPIGELMEPTGTLSFQQAYDLFAEQVNAGVQAGIDLIVIETMTDLYEVKAAILAAKECCEQLGKALPVLVSMTFEANGRTFTGCCVPSMAAVIEGLGADAIGFNCSLGPVELLPFARQLRENTSLPLFIKPNAGLPDPLTGSYSIDAAKFADCMQEYLALGIHLFGGCCGTDPSFIRAMRQMLDQKCPQDFPTPVVSRQACVCTPTCFVPIDRVRIIGERINPTGKKRLKQAILEQDFDYILSQGLSQLEAGAQILDVNMGMPEVDESRMLPLVIQKLQGVLDAPLQIDSSNVKAIEQALRFYNGKPIVNSVNGEEGSMNAILPLVKKYGAAVVALTLDDKGIPLLAEERFAIAERIVAHAEQYGIPREDIYVDCLTLTASVQQKEVVETLKAMRMVKEQLGCRTLLGVSNISFGLPNREAVTRTFLTMALENGLDLPIINPNIASMAEAVRAFRLLRGFDVNCAAFVEAYANMPTATAAATPTAAAKPAAEKAPETLDLPYAMSHGLKNEGAKITAQLLETTDAMEVVNDILIPALDSAGKLFEQGKIFLPQLIQTASVAQAAFEVIKTTLIERNAAPVSRGEIVLATVKGDIHDIGKNIVRVLLENYGYTVLDLGRDVPCQLVADTAKEHGVKLVGLSALMTTTLGAMEETIQLVKASCPDCKIVVGGAVLTADYAEKIGADYYAKDAMETVAVAKEVVG